MASQDKTDEKNHYVLHRPDMTQIDKAAHRPSHIRVQPMAAATVLKRNPYSLKERASMSHLAWASQDKTDEKNHDVLHRPDMPQIDMVAYRPSHIRVQPMAAATVLDRNPYSLKERASMGHLPRPPVQNNMLGKMMRPRSNIPIPNSYHRHGPHNGHPPATMAPSYYTKDEQDPSVGYYKSYQNDVGISFSAAAAAAEAASTAYEETLQAELSRASHIEYEQYSKQTSASSHVENIGNLPKTPTSAHFRSFHSGMAGISSQRRIVDNFHNSTASMPAISGSNLTPGLPADLSQDPLLKSPTNMATKDDRGAWGVMFEALMLFKAKHGHCRVPLHYSPDTQLAKWVKHQISSRIGLSSHEREKLDSLGLFGVSDQAAKNPHESSSISSSNINNPRSSIFWENHWNEMLERLKKYKEKEGHTIVPFPFEENPQLGYWVKKQRLKKKRLSKERLQKLEKLGFEWEQETKTQDEVWDEMFERLKAFGKINGHCFVPSRYKEDPKLGSWVHRQRHTREIKKLRSDRLLKLQSIGFI